MLASRTSLLAFAGALLAVAALQGCGGSSSDPGCTPATETCNGLDDDCDGTADEGFDVGAACTAGVGACQAAGQRVCAASGAQSECGAVAGVPSAETCNQIDDDCDGATDNGLAGCCVPSTTRDCGATVGACVEGTETCSAQGAWGPCLDGNGAPVVLPGTVAETCNGVDDDCDGAVDQGFDVGASCSAGVGACATADVKVCLQDGTGTTCPAVPGTPGTETCNGVDDDCDGQSDEDLLPPACPNQQGVCAGATATCSGAGGWICQNGPSYEETEASCDGLDNDCDGETDESLSALCPKQAGVCAGATATCGGSAGWLACDATNYGPSYVEDEVICDGLDNDCDGTVDEGLMVYRDADGDGWGNQAISQRVCPPPPAGWVPEQPPPRPDGIVYFDCDDTKAAVNPGHHEVCFNGLDDDCDGTVDERICL